METLEIIESLKVSLEYDILTKQWVATIKDYADYDYHNSSDYKNYKVLAKNYGTTISQAVSSVNTAYLTRTFALHWLPKGRFEYPARDCYWLVRELRRHYNLSTPDFSWVYELYPTIESQPKNLAEHCLTQCAELRTGTPQHLDIALLSQNINADLGTVLEINNELWIAYMNRRGSTLEPLNRRIGCIVKSYWTLF